MNSRESERGLNCFILLTGTRTLFKNNKAKNLHTIGLSLVVIKQKTEEEEEKLLVIL